MMRKVLFWALFFLPVLILLPGLGQFPFITGSAFTDLAVSHYPNGLFIQQSLQQWKTIPLWSPRILSGYPFAANPLSGLYYLPGWLALAFPLPFGFNLLTALHLIWAGVGMYFFLRAEGLSERAALLGALTFESMPKLFSHIGAGHLTLLYAISWTPWLLLAELKAHPVVQWNGGRFRLAGAIPALRRVLVTGAVLGIIVLADVRWTAYAGLLWLAFSLRCLINFKRRQGGATFISMLPAWAVLHMAVVLFAVLLAAPVLLPLAEYSQLSTRSLLTAAESFYLSLPPGLYLGLFFPTFSQTAEWILYPGAVTLALTLYALGAKPVRRMARFWLGVVAVTLIFALGSNLPGLELVARIPGFDLLRVPPRMIFLTGFGFAVLAGYAVQGVINHLSQNQVKARDRSTTPLVVVTLTVVLFAAGVILMVEEDWLRVQFVWGAAALLLGTAALLLILARQVKTEYVFVIICVISMADMIGVNSAALDFRPVDEVLARGRDAAEFITNRSGEGLYRVYSPTYSIEQQVGAWYQLEQADGVDPLQLMDYVDYMSAAAGFSQKGYDVTLPPYTGDQDPEDSPRYYPDAKKLGLLNVRYIVSAYDLPVDHLTLLETIGDTRIYENDQFLPRAWVQQPELPPGEGILSQPDVDWQPNRIKVQAKGPGLLVLSELYYPGWRVYVDGQPGTIEPTGGLLRGVTLADGSHSVEFIFSPVVIYIGLGISGAACLLLIFLFAARRSKSA